VLPFCDFAMVAIDAMTNRKPELTPVLPFVKLSVVP
jgi:hypothetical protein